MLEFLDGPKHVLTLKASGQLQGEDIDSAVAEIESRLAAFEAIGIVADITEMSGMSLEALAKDFASQFRFFGQWHRFPKAALIADEGFLAGVARRLQGLLPGIQLKVYGRGEAEAAKAFAASVEPKPIRA